MTSKDDVRLAGRYPEFSRMSNRPGIGLSAMHDVADVMLRFNFDLSEADVPISLRHGSRELPLGRYLRRNLRMMIGKEANAPQVVLDQVQSELQPMWEAAKDAASKVLPVDYRFREAIIQKYKGKVASIEAKSRIFKNRRKL